MIPASTKALARERNAFGAKPSVWPLRDSDGRTWAERKALKEKGLLS